MRQICLILLLVMLCGSTGCGVPAEEALPLITVTSGANTQDEAEVYSCRLPVQVDEPLVVVTSGGETVEAYDHWENSFDGEICADGPPLYEVLPEIDGEIPVLRYDEDFSFSVRKDVTYRGMYVGTSEGDLKWKSVKPEKLAELDGGTHYVCFAYVQYGLEIQEDLRTYDGGRCVIKLVIPE